MNIPSAKDLKKLADSCRKAGIKHFKSGDLEFTLSDEAPISNYKKTKASKEYHASTDSGLDPNFTSDDPTEDQLLFWSAAGDSAESTEDLQ